MVAPNTPSLTATAQNADASVLLVAQGTSANGHTYSNTTITIEYSDDGSTWITLRDAYREAPATNFRLTVSDYESPLNKSRSYRARVRSTVDPFEESNNSTVRAATVVATEWWLKDPLDNTVNMMVQMSQDQLNLHRKEDQAKFSALGRKNMIVVRDVIHGVDFSPMHFEFVDYDEYEKFVALRDKQTTLLLQSPMYSGRGRQWYVSMDSDGEERWFNTSDVLLQYIISLTEVDRPPTPADTYEAEGGFYNSTYEQEIDGGTP